MTRPTAKEVKAIAEIAGVPVDNEIAARIANSIGPAFDGFAAIAGTLQFENADRTVGTGDREVLVDEIPGFAAARNKSTP